MRGQGALHPPRLREHLALGHSPPALASRAPALLGVLAAAALLVPSPGEAAQRFAVIAGNDVGAPGRPHLWYAERDAERFRDTMLELGDFEPDHIVLLKGKGRDALLAALERVERHVVEEKAKGEPTLLVIYYSGHAGPRGLELGADRVSFEEIREATARSSAAARVVIVDACEAGALTQVKGAWAANVDFALPEHEVQGTAFVASTAVGEVAICMAGWMRGGNTMPTATAASTAAATQQTNLMKAIRVIGKSPVPADGCQNQCGNQDGHAGKNADAQADLRASAHAALHVHRSHFCERNVPSHDRPIPGNPQFESFLSDGSQSALQLLPLRQFQFQPGIRRKGPNPAPDFYVNPGALRPARGGAC